MTNKEFILTIAPIIKRVSEKRGYKFPSAIIAQACNESAYGRSSLGKNYNNFFGMKCGSSWKGKSVNMKTKEEYTIGTLTEIMDNFRAYDTIEDGVNGYFDFINYDRYYNLKDATSSRNYLELIKADGYATSSKYVDNVYAVVETQNLLKWDSSQLETPTKSNETIATEVLRGEWGNGEDRRSRITSAGYDYNTIQGLVNQRHNYKPASNKKTDKEIAVEVIRGDWGNGLERKQRINGAGYNYNNIQKIVNSMF